MATSDMSVVGLFEAEITRDLALLEKKFPGMVFTSELIAQRYFPAWETCILSRLRNIDPEVLITSSNGYLPGLLRSINVHGDLQKYLPLQCEVGLVLSRIKIHFEWQLLSSDQLIALHNILESVEETMSVSDFADADWYSWLQDLWLITPFSR